MAVSNHLLINITNYSNTLQLYVYVVQLYYMIINPWISGYDVEWVERSPIVRWKLEM